MDGKKPKSAEGKTGREGEGSTQGGVRSQAGEGEEKRQELFADFRHLERQEPERGGRPGGELVFDPDSRARRIAEICSGTLGLAVTRGILLQGVGMQQ